MNKGMKNWPADRCQLAACRAVIALALTLFCTASAGQDVVETVAQIARRLDAEFANLEHMMQPRELTDSARSVSQDLEELKLRSVMLIGQRKERWEELAQQVRAMLNEGSRVSSADPAWEKAISKSRELWKEMKSLYPPEALEVLPPLWSCPMHQELMQDKAGSCPVCGMALEPIYETQPQLSRIPIVRAEIIAERPLEVGKSAQLRIRLLFSSDGQPVELGDLEETHTRKVHLLIVDLSQTDYHHEHPEPVAPGEYAFSFTPAKPDTYRVWADLKPVRTHIEQYSVADIPSNTPGQTQLDVNEPGNRHAEIDGYKFDLSFGSPLLREKDTIPGVLHVTGPDNQPFTRLQVVMGAFGHFVGYSEDFASVLHVHPVGRQPEGQDSLGGPDLPFYFRSNTAGVVRFFAQVRIGGRDFFPRFVISVQPLQHLPGI